MWTVLDLHRLRLLREVRARGTLHATAVALGYSTSAVSQQLAVLRANNIVAGRKEGVMVRYSLRDPLIAELLSTARRIFNNHLVSTQDLLRQLKQEHRRRS